MKVNQWLAAFLILALNALNLRAQSANTNSIESIKAAAEKGDAQAQVNLGFRYFYGVGVTPDYAEAAKWDQKAADQDFSEGQYNLGLCYANGYGVTRDYAEALKWYRKAAEQGLAEAQCDIGTMYATGHGVPQDYSQAAKWFRKAANQGNALAQWKLGFLYQEGLGIPQDYAEALGWIRKAAIQGCEGAQYDLGVTYAQGQAAPQDYGEAAKWFLKAAGQGDPQAQFSLGTMYLKGQGVSQDFVQAYRWYNSAATQGETNAIQMRGILINSMTPEQIAEGQRLSAAFVPTTQSPVSNPDSQINANSPIATGTGFFITDDGYLISNYHVVKDASKVRLLTSSGTVDAEVVQVDAADDLALLKAVGNFAVLPVVSSRNTTIGSTVATVGFPDPGLQGFAPKLAKGEIAALAGAADDPRYFQISVPVQPGNSGGALVDEHGNVVGIVSAKLDAATALKASGALPENVNYAIKSSFLLSFLESVPAVGAGLKVPNVADEKFEDVAKQTEAATAMVLVY